MAMLLILLLVVGLRPADGTPETGSSLGVVIGVTAEGEATDRWRAMLRKRLPEAGFEAVARVRKPLRDDEQAWADVIHSRIALWQRETPALATLFAPVAPPRHVSIVVGNRGAEDAFTHDSTTIGFDLAVLHRAYGDAARPENVDRLDRFFRHEYVHLLQKAWLQRHPFEMRSPIERALAEMWTEGLGNYFSLSDRWRATGGQPSELAASTLATLEPRLAARLSALACASPERTVTLTADLSSGRFDGKWGALSTALWLERDASLSDQILRGFVMAGPQGIWDLAARHLPASLQAVVTEARAAKKLCTES